jgi:hypothetical protein
VADGAVDHAADIAALQRKYAALLRLRLSQVERGDRPASAAPVAELRRLATEFPGVLRELEVLDDTALNERYTATGLALHEGRPQTWMRWMSEYHGMMAFALSIKRVLSKQREPSEARCAELWFQHSHRGKRHALDPSCIAAIASPPRGRLNVWVFGELGRRFGVDADTIERTLFPSLTFSSRG